MQGGNAVDAAVATAAALNVVEPYMSGLGGVGYMLIYDAKKKERKILDYVGLTPRATSLEHYDSSEKHARGPLTPLVPGACGGWFEALTVCGTMDAQTVFTPAIEYADQGFSLTVNNHLFIQANVADLLKYSSPVPPFLLNGKAPPPGGVLVQKDLAQTLRLLAEGGSNLFYRGEIAERMVVCLQGRGGLLTHEDLSGFSPVWLNPIHVDYRGYQILAPPPPCQAIQYLETLNIMEGFDVAAMGHNTTTTLHRFIEAAKLATADRAEYAAIEHPPMAGLLSKRYAAERRRLIGEGAQTTGGARYTATKMEGEVLAGDPYGWMKTECTTHFDVVDGQGNAVAVTQSLGTTFGSALQVPGTGIFLNNFMFWFDREPGSPNVIGPSKKIEMCLSPAQVWDKQGLRLLIGTPGSYGILQTTPQMIMNIVDHNLNVQAAIEAPRLVATTPGRRVDLETRILREVRAELGERGHQLNLLGDWSAQVGGGQGIMIDPETGSFMGGADPRRDGYAVGW